MKHQTTTFFQSPYTGETISIRQSLMNPKAGYNRHRKSWLCPHCKHTWKGHRRLWRENRTPDRCPRCSNTKKIKQVTK